MFDWYITNLKKRLPEDPDDPADTKYYYLNETNKEKKDMEKSTPYNIKSTRGFIIKKSKYYDTISEKEKTVFQLDIPGMEPTDKLFKSLLNVINTKCYLNFFGSNQKKNKTNLNEHILSIIKNGELPSTTGQNSFSSYNVKDLSITQKINNVNYESGQSLFSPLLKLNFKKNIKIFDTYGKFNNDLSLLKTKDMTDITDNKIIFAEAMTCLLYTSDACRRRG